MEVSQVLAERARWDKYMPLFANLLRPSTVLAPVVEMPIPDSDAINDSITKFRDSSDGQTLKNWGDLIVTLVFDGYAEWAEYYAAQPEWVLVNLAQALENAEQQTALLTHLQNIADVLPEARNECLMSFKNDIDLWVPRWQSSANTELAGAEGRPPEGQERAQVYPNTDSWNYSRTPGTFYYKYVQRDGKNVHVYNDNAGAAAEDWHEMKYWDDLAETEANKPGNKVTAQFPDWGPSWAGWSVLASPVAEGRRVFGKADEGRWYDYNGAIEARNKEQQAQAQAVQQAQVLRAEMGQNIHDVILVPTAEQVLRELPPEMAAREGIDVLVRQRLRDHTSQKAAIFTDQREDERNQ